ncbi:MAG: hypothetical protein H3Z50_07750 [archaeon]|nr:hypothetical protein [archaeon]MCP8306567.1 hypothetical protein [archaeon]
MRDQARGKVGRPKRKGEHKLSVQLIASYAITYERPDDLGVSLTFIRSYV